MTRTYQLTAGNVISKARYILQDESDGTYRWSNKELIGWLNDAINSMLGIVPALFSETVQHTCSAGYRQTIVNARSVALIEIVGVPPADVAVLAQFMPGWQTAAPGAIKNWMRIEGDQLSFYCTPPSADGQPLQAVVVVSPIPMDSTTDILPVPENYEPALVDYVVAMAQAKDDESIDMNRMQLFQANFAARVKGA